MVERDNLLNGFDQTNKMYIVTPTPMMEWMNIFKKELNYPEMVVLIPSEDLNPEPIKYYLDNEEDSRYCAEQNTKPSAAK